MVTPLIPCTSAASELKHSDWVSQNWRLGQSSRRRTSLDSPYRSRSAVLAAVSLEDGSTAVWAVSAAPLDMMMEAKTAYLSLSSIFESDDIIICVGVGKALVVRLSLIFQSLLLVVMFNTFIYEKRMNSVKISR